MIKRYDAKNEKTVIKIMPIGISIKKLVEVDIIDEVIYCKEPRYEDNIINLMWYCEQIGIKFKFSKLPSENILYLANLDKVKNLISFEEDSSDYSKILIKRLFELFVTILMIIILFPLMVVISLIIKLSSKGPIFFIQHRVGLNGRKFNLYKFRTMVVNAENIKDELLEYNMYDGPAFKIKNDPRIIPACKILRKSGLDELPQLINVLKGEMHLIGPRPPLPSEVEQYERKNLKRLSVKPGITCTWQISPKRNEISFNKWMDMDIAYVDKWNLKKDITILFKTLKTVINKSGF